jgi:tetratricopeptide (TPR) repeat protein
MHPESKRRSRQGILVFAAASVTVAVCWLMASSPHLAGQAGPSSDPAPLFILMNKIDHNEMDDAERLMKDNLAVTKTRLEELINERDTRFDELGRFGATSGHEVHKEVLDQFIQENTRYARLFDLYRKLTDDEMLSKRFEARRLRYEGAFLTHDGEDVCGDTLDWGAALNHYREALEKLDAAFALAQEVNDTRLMASAKINIGSTLVRMVEPEKAIAAYTEGMRYADQLPGEMYRGMVRMNMGNTYVWIGEPDKSMSYAQSALESFRKMGRGTWEANAQLLIGNAQMHQKNLSSAWETLRLALDLAVQSGEDRVRGKALINLGSIAVLLNRPTEATAYLEQARDWFGNHGEVYTAIERETVEQDGLLLLSEAAKQAGNKDQAEQYRQEFLRSLAASPGRYNAVRESPCYALYKARPVKQQAAR